MGATDPGRRELTVSEFHSEYDRCYRTCHRGLVVMATHMLAGDLHHAQDLVNDAFVKAFRAWDTIDNPKHWLKKVIARDAIRSKRQWKKRLADLARIHAAERSRPVPDPAALTEQREDYNRVMRALSALSDRQRTIAVLCWHEEWSQTQVAEALGITPSSVAKHLNRASAKLAREFGAHGETLNYFHNERKDPL
ncbi:sigma-70 family RNA polymerase sigma factor [Streptomyces sp. NBC_00016]|uniref:RNA polymerase sigma factor n=1 Tax=Streptomyces sp. NBC_00016 TaxID=2975622 RepID=UPI003248A021